MEEAEGNIVQLGQLALLSLEDGGKQLWKRIAPGERIEKCGL